MSERKDKLEGVVYKTENDKSRLSDLEGRFDDAIERKVPLTPYRGTPHPDQAAVVKILEDFRRGLRGMK
jgi:hypothetical protein